MGVKTCSRAGCENIMCDRYSEDYGYICYSCFQDLIDSGPETNISSFMNIAKIQDHRNKRRAAEARYEVEFPERI